VSSYRRQVDRRSADADARCPHRPAKRRRRRVAAWVPLCAARTSQDPRPAGSARLIDLGNVDVTNITFNPELPSYELANLRWGVSTDRWEGSVFVNNLFDERAFLSVDRERGRSARVGYLTNVPRTYGVNFRVKF